MKLISWGFGMAFLCLAIAGLPQPAARAVADTTPPTGTIVINSNRSATNTPNVTLALTWSDGTGSGVSRMRFSDNGSTWTPWEALATTRAYTLPPGPDGHRTVRVQYLDRANNRSAAFSDYILLDTTPPTGGIAINNGDAATLTRAVTLNLNWTDTGSGVTRMRFSDNGSTWTAWGALATAHAHKLPLPDGYHTVRVQYLDGAGNRSAVYSDYIKLQTTETVLLPDGTSLAMVWIPGGDFMMGRYPDEPGSSAEEDPRHQVTLGGFWMGKYELTKRQWAAVMGTTPWTEAGQGNWLANPDSPAVYVSWDDAQLFITALNGQTGKTFRLPSEAQWEYACRADTATRFYWGDDLGGTLVGDFAWYWGNCSIEYYGHVVGQKPPNEYGLHDMNGNVWEWCQDLWHGNYSGAPTDGSAWESSTYSMRTFRGGSWGNDAENCRSAQRSGAAPDGTSGAWGFRLAR
jgi:formylglycine-generating enzyme required for sulfatase activity